jgi:carbamoyl-phosphate synthase large subunit|tara:strand:- start:1073 stop:1996 length:924 start_codon:yes stop_codon:yes gene_type:complete
MNILLLSAGGSACHGVIKSLRDIDFDGKIISVDCNSLSAGFYLSDEYYIVPEAFDEHYIDELVKIVKEEKIDLILPTSSNEIIIISKNKKIFDELGVMLFMSDYDAIMDCSDKMRFYDKCKDNFLLPKTSMDYTEIGFPLFAKPRRHSAGSKGVFVCKDQATINCLETDKYEYIYQEYLPGQEYTIDVLSDMNSNPLVVIPRKRLQTKAGISTKGRVKKDEFIERQCQDIVQFLKLKGSVCLQMKEDFSGNLKFIEINPRFGGGTVFAKLAGVDIVKIILDIVEGKEINIPEIKEVTILRYFQEVVC